ncbi:MAG TPA: alpha-amylase family glycosyl hydrolase [Bacilli bacterium]|nr:alpha-amylase family glycosyl hydrolase [Bacilli bacterium]
MAVNTSIELRNKIFYQIFVRQFSEKQNFQGVIEKLDEIKNLEVDVIQLLPIHPIGLKNRKGNVGSPYSIMNYYEIDSALGTIDDFTNFLAEVHKRGMKVIIDIVFNHTSHDAVYTKTHPEWYYRKDDGSFCNRVGDWWDIIDFDFTNNKPLEDELINVLKYWAKIGVDGYRCDVAPLLPLKFWRRARQELTLLYPDLIYVSESVHLSFIKYLRDMGFEACSDSEIYQVFDICYDYDIFDDFTNYLRGKNSLEKWADGLLKQESIYPKNYVKLRYLENHDFDRAASFCKNDVILRNATAMLYFLKGTQFIYNGQECGLTHRPDLFEDDVIDWSDYNKASLVTIMKILGKLKKEHQYLNGVMEIEVIKKEFLKISYKLPSKKFIGIFNFGDSETLEVEAGYDVLMDKEIPMGMKKIIEPLVMIVNL